MSLRRVVHVLAGTGFGGAERVACSLAKLARDDGLEVNIEGAPATVAGLEAAGFSLASKECTLADWTQAVRRRLADLGPTIVHVHLSTPSLLGWAMRIVRRRPALLTFHLLPHGAWPVDQRLRLPSKWMIAAATRLSSRLYVNAVSSIDAGVLDRLVPAEKLSTVVNAPPVPSCDGGETHAVWSDAGTRLLVVGRLVQQKGIDRLLRALSASELLSVPWHLVVVGDGPERSALARICAELRLEKRVTWVGAVPATAWMRHADLVLCGSRYEGMPLVPLESVREGVPVVVSDIPSHEELFACAPQSLLPADEREWSKTLYSCLCDDVLRRDLVRAQSAILPLCDPRRQWREYRTLYEEISGMS